MKETSEVVLTVPRALKGSWVAQSRRAGMKLTDWIVEKMEVEQNYDGFTLSVAAFAPFEAYVASLSSGDARSLLKRIKTIDASQTEAIAAIKIAKSYLEKRVAITGGIADKHLFHDINVDALGYFSAHQELTHLDLIQALGT